MDRAKELARTRELIREYEVKLAEAKASDPFWYYEPSDGLVGEDGLGLMREFLKEEDIPVGRLDCQLDVHKSVSEIVLAAGGNQSGKTVAGAIEAFIKVTGEVPEALEGVYPAERIPKTFPNHVRVVGVDFQTFMRNLLPTYQKWVPREYLPGGRWDQAYNSEARTLKLGKKGVLTGTIEFMTNEQDVRSFQGPPRHKVIYDEEPRYEIYKENLMRFSTADRLDVLFCMTPTEGMSWVKDAILDRSETEEGNTIECFKVPSITNKRINIVVLRELLKGLGSYDEIRMRLLGEFVSLSGLVYGRLFNKNIHVIEPFPVGGKSPDGKEDYSMTYFVVRGIDPHLVKPSACVELAVDREGIEYVVGCYLNDADTEILKKELSDRAKTRKYRLGWSIFDKSADSTLRIIGDKNIFTEMTRGEDYIPGAFKSEKFTGSINAGVDEIKQLLKLHPVTGKPKLFFFNIPELKPLIQAMTSMERDSYPNEESKGKKDRIKEGKWDLHACLRYIHQRPVVWCAPMEKVPEPVEERYV